MLDVSAVFKSFGRFRAVNNVSFRLEPGEIAGLLGPNGAGKTTTIRMITGYLPPDQGRILVDGRDTVTESIEARQSLGYLPESAPLYPEMTPKTYLNYRASLYQLPRGDRAAAIGQAIDRCWLGDVANKRISALSKGYKQRVGLAAALLHNPRVLILDEPTNALDPTQVRETRTLIRELAKDRVVLLSSHILAEVELVCTRVVVIVRGQVRADGRPKDMLAGQSAPITLGWTHGDADVSDRLIAQIRGLTGVHMVSELGREGTHVKIRIEGYGGGGDLKERIAKAVHSTSVVVDEFSQESPTLERLFVDLVSKAADESVKATAGSTKAAGQEAA
jgi:ABC-2 type transport system ATP-binding protein